MSFLIYTVYLNMTSLNKILCTLLLFSCAGGAFSQDEQSLKRYFEGKTVTLKLDMPATADGIDIHPYRSTPMDFDDYSKRLKDHGTSIFSGDQIMITKIKQKKKHIEFQLGGGGYGTMGDDDARVDKPYLRETDEEKDLKEEIKKETDKSEKSKLERELRKLQRTRRVEQERINMEAEQLQAAKEENVRRKAFESGSRFNIRYDVKVGVDQLNVESIKNALAKYIDFKTATMARSSEMIIPNNSSKVIKKGLLWEEAAQLYGAPSSVSQRNEGTLKVTECSFEKEDQIITAMFVEGVLVKYSISSK